METPPDSEEQLARLIDRHLRQLPSPKAPRGLSQRVLAAIAALESRPWWEKSWFHWPRHFQTLFLAAALVLIGLAGWYSSALDPLAMISHARDSLLAHLSFVQPFITFIAGVGNALINSARSASQTFWIITGAFLAVTYVTCVGLGTLCYRLAISNANQPSL